MWELSDANMYQMSKQHFGQIRKEYSAGRGTISSMQRSIAYKILHSLTFTFFFFSISQRLFGPFALCKRGIPLPFFFLLNLKTTDNKWHLNSPEGSAASCHREMQNRVGRYQCTIGLVWATLTMSNKTAGWKLTFVHVCLCVWRSRKIYTCASMQFLVAVTLALTHTYYMVLNCYMARSETPNMTSASCAGDTESYIVEYCSLC